MRSTLARRLCLRLGDAQQRSNSWRQRAYHTNHASAGRLGAAAVLGGSGIGLFVHEGSRATAQEKEDASLLTRKRMPLHVLWWDLLSYIVHAVAGIQIFSGTAHPKLAQAVAAELGISLAAADISKFKCGGPLSRYSMPFAPTQRVCEKVRRRSKLKRLSETTTCSSSIPRAIPIPTTTSWKSSSSWMRAAAPEPEGSQLCFPSSAMPDRRARSHEVDRLIPCMLAHVHCTCLTLEVRGRR